MTKRFLAACMTGLMAGLMMGTSALAQQDGPVFPIFSAENPQRIGIVSKLTPERRAALGGFLNEADTRGIFPPNVEAQGREPFGIVLYILADWQEAKQLPPSVLPPLVAKQLEGINPTFYRYAIPAEIGSGKTIVLMFYITRPSDDDTLKCLAEDIVLTLESGFDSSAVAPCIKQAG